MKIKNIIIIWALGLMLFLTGCYKDLGNYEYEDIDRVSQITGIESDYTVVRGFTALIINPKIEFELNHTNETDLEFDWRLQYTKWTYSGIKIEEKILSTEKVLDTIIDDRNIPFGEHKLLFTVRNTKTTLEYKQVCNIDLVSLFSKGDYFLYETSNGNSELYVINKDGIDIDSVYFDMTGLILPGKPLGMGEMQLARDKNDLILYTNQTPDYGSIIDLSNYVYKAPAVNTLQNNVTGELDMTVCNFYLLKGLFSDAKMLVNGDYYFYSSVLSANYKPSINLDLPTLQNIDCISRLPMDKPIMHQASTGFLFYSSERLSSKYYSVNRLARPGHFPQINKVYPGECLFIGNEPFASPPGNNDAGDIFGIRLIMKDQGLIKEYLLQATQSITGQNMTLIKDLGIVKDFSGAHLIEDNTLWTESLSTRYFYFSAGNIIYRYNYDNSSPEYEPEPFITLPDGYAITYLNMDGDWDIVYSTVNTKLVIAAYHPELDQSGCVYYYRSNGELISSYENICGKIISRIHRE